MSKNRWKSDEAKDCAVRALAAGALALTGVLFGSNTAKADPPPVVQETAPPPAVQETAPPPAVQETAPPPAAQETAPPPAFPKKIGGHIGIATPLVTVSKKTTSIADQLTVLTPIGIGFKVSEHVAIDFETVVATPVHQPGSTTGLVVDPGIIYGFGKAAVGLRVAFKINNAANVGLIPLINYGLVDLGCATWFVEAAFPTFYSADASEFNAVLHTGLGF
jgi:hypothetical protein